MAYTTIKKPSDYFNTKLYTGNSSTQSITGVGFQPDFTWIKIRSIGYNHRLQDSVRGATKSLFSNLTNAEQTNTDGVLSFDSDGFSLGNDVSNGSFNSSGNTFASWNWLGANGTTANTDGSISSTVSASTTSGFSIVSYTGTEANATVGHGLGVAPKMIIVKRLNGTTDWAVGHQEADTSNPWNKYLQLNDPTVPLDRQVFNDTAPTNSVFSVGADILTNASAAPMIAYCFAEKKGFSKFGKYTGNGNDDGTFVYTGFKPAFIMVKITAGQTDNWIMQDNKINSFNGASSQRLRPNSSGAEFSSSNEIDLLSNGFKTHGNDGEINGSGFSYIYMAFAEQPLIGDNPATAR